MNPSTLVSLHEPGLEIPLLVSKTSLTCKNSVKKSLLYPLLAMLVMLLPSPKDDWLLSKLTLATDTSLLYGHHERLVFLGFFLVSCTGMFVHLCPLYSVLLSTAPISDCLHSLFFACFLTFSNMFDVILDR